MTGYKIELGDQSFEAMLYAVRERVRRFPRSPSPDNDYRAHYALVEERLEHAYPLIGVESIRFPHSHLVAVLDVMVLAVLSMPKRGQVQRHTLNSQKLKLKKHLASDVVSRMASLTK